jgi:hypothetical protein
VQAEVPQIGSCRIILHHLYNLLYVGSFGGSLRFVDKFDSTPTSIDERSTIIDEARVCSPANVQDASCITSDAAHSHGS